MIGRERSHLTLFIVLLGFGLLTATYAIWVQGSQIRANQGLIRQQQETVDALLAQSAEDKQALEAQQRFVTALQGQVRKLGGSPLLQAPSPVAPQPAQGPTVAVPSSPPTTPGPHPAGTASPTPSPKGSPPESPTPRPSPSPTCRVILGRVCLRGT